ncbi:MAG: hypothetical protein ACE367_27210 [Acidimicrobiales bacterium]
MTAHDHAHHQAPDPTLVSFGCISDAVALAFDLAERLDRAHLAALSDGRTLLEATAFTHPQHTLDHAFGWSLAFAHLLGVERPVMTLFSVVAFDVAEVRECDLALFRRYRHLAEPWLEVRDWLITDGLEVRSLGVSAMGPAAWPGCADAGCAGRSGDEDLGLW